MIENIGGEAEAEGMGWRAGGKGQEVKDRGNREGKHTAGQDTGIDIVHGRLQCTQADLIHN